MQGVQGMGMLGSLGSSSQMRPGGIPAHHQQRPVQSSLRPPSTPPNQPSTSQVSSLHFLLFSLTDINIYDRSYSCLSWDELLYRGTKVF